MHEGSVLAYRFVCVIDTFDGYEKLKDNRQLPAQKNVYSAIKSFTIEIYTIKVGFHAFLF